MDIIVTDLTRFSINDKVCIAGIDVKLKQCIRPLPYIEKATCRKLKILPGAILEGKFSKPKSIDKPHTEDMNYDGLSFKGPCTSEEFESVLKASMYPSINKGFDCKVPAGMKLIPPDDPPSRSIITLKLNPSQIQIVQSSYNPKSLRLNIKDNDGRKYEYLSITDIGFYNLAVSKQKDPNYTDELNRYILSQKEVYLRIGLGRRYKNPNDGRDGFWIQINGIYTFPEFMTEVRTY
ncbi:MAG: hypothetical protein COZ31_00230 [Nitrospirae bacterium CG_4_10_14_3_um_filter_44_29]|nr:hypothetical protein [Nitrospirota bacterium]OIO30456.1 MAG: hypothetical protein AUJ60_02805 [Nitrospirae bacterium CG1_02_44_142]PIP70569.1 MAG: hypothetical protein COW90_04635 [Nitrospirae bacterium CG22_combo_CG10-13_8_21_14_all_44_11]PIV40270.1 MAG: hypothetical protein COS28_09725 [Nitrospirae bacterium CG02_land_8_20_14_3_00_44_33]PIV65665.1 MAG: hypothetical protein COS10_10230 [Nitrospirae bacterium CG01_land_8_20_14_3_00_44_22]PIW88663.1 MAG: hypothetical protein COZ93_09165 [Nit